MKQVLSHYPNLVSSVKGKQCRSIAQSSVNIIIIGPRGSIYPVFFEIDDGGYSTQRDEIEPDDLTDYGYWRRNHPEKSENSLRYGDDD